MGKLINPNRFKIHRSYTIQEVSETCDVHKRTVRNWIKSGLPVIDGSRPCLILGTELRIFIRQQRRKNKRICKPSEAYCCRCREPRKFDSGSVKFIEEVGGIGRVFGRCKTCGSKVNKFFSWRTLDVLRSKLELEITDSTKTHSYEVIRPRELSLSQGSQG
ncbi:helix-turn-helix domain-containing protein [Vibrio mediterranei]|uniref:helix-turn-helix domain-containing protein n=1 Tax=Vibrio mediterranei TaxID=689 RepID=UPI004067B013